MMVTGSRLRQIGWAAVFIVCLAAFMLLTFRVNAVKADVQHAERNIVQLERTKTLLETEFQTRANQQQLSDWNDVEFGYRAPKADQYLENERQLANLGEPRGTNAPAPIRVAHEAAPKESALIAMVSPLTGKLAQAASAEEEAPEERPTDLAERLSLVDMLPEAPSINTPSITSETSE